MNRNELLAVIAGALAVVLLVAVPTWITTSNATKRLEECVRHGGSYVLVPNSGSKMECDQRGE